MPRGAGPQRDRPAVPLRGSGSSVRRYSVRRRPCQDNRTSRLTLASHAATLGTLSSALASGDVLEEISHIDAVDSVRVLANDERLHLLRLLMRGPATLTQLGAVMGHHPAWVRHHLLSLEHAGLVELVETRQTKNYVEKYYCATARAYAVNFMVLPEVGEAGLLVLLGSDDLALDLLAQRLRESEGAPDVVTIAMGSLEGLIALRQGLGHVAGCHLLDPETGDFNRSYARALFPGRELQLITLAHRQQGLIVPPGNPRGFQRLDDAVAQGARIVNRNRGSGTRVWLDRLLAAAGVDPADVAGYEHEVATHGQAARRRRRRHGRRGARHLRGGARPRPRLRAADGGALRPRDADASLRERPAGATAGAPARRRIQAVRGPPRRVRDARDRRRRGAGGLTAAARRRRARQRSWQGSRRAGGRKEERMHHSTTGRRSRTHRWAF